jgi:hypothetical protein
MKNIELRHDNHQIQYGSNQCEKMSVFPNEKDTLPNAIWVLRMLLLTKSAVNDVFVASNVHFQRSCRENGSTFDCNCEYDIDAVPNAMMDFRIHKLNV